CNAKRPFIPLLSTSKNLLVSCYTNKLMEP
ncbi:hypothetical protein ISN45_At02g031720, partial [Arabidopsis thaliana x Arabidopsis arenosa]